MLWRQEASVGSYYAVLAMTRGTNDPAVMWLVLGRCGDLHSAFKIRWHNAKFRRQHDHLVPNDLIDTHAIRTGSHPSHHSMRSGDTYFSSTYCPPRFLHLLQIVARCNAASLKITKA
jgi:hypothetical protein